MQFLAHFTRAQQDNATASADKLPLHSHTGLASEPHKSTSMACMQQYVQCDTLGTSHTHHMAVCAISMHAPRMPAAHTLHCRACTIQSTHCSMNTQCVLKTVHIWSQFHCRAHTAEATAALSTLSVVSQCRHMCISEHSALSITGNHLWHFCVHQHSICMYCCSLVWHLHFPLCLCTCLSHAQLQLCNDTCVCLQLFLQVYILATDRGTQRPIDRDHQPDTDRQRQKDCLESNHTDTWPCSYMLQAQVT
jgi:hypothetical protein